MTAGLPDLVPEQSTTRVTTTGPLGHLCPHVDEVDAGAVAISWTCSGQTLELHSLAAYLDSFARERISHEGLTHRVQSELAGLGGITDVVVTSTWRTAGLDVVVESRGATRPAAPRCLHGRRMDEGCGPCGDQP